MLDNQVVADSFREIFRRDGNNSEIANFASLPSLDAALDAMISAAVHTAKVATYYQIYYNRLPEAGGFDFWVDIVASNPGFTDAALALEFFNAGEFTALYGHLTTEEAVTALYRNVLGREPDAEGLAFWTDLVIQNNNFDLQDLGFEFVIARETQTTFAPLIDAYLTALATGNATAGGNLFDFAGQSVPEEDKSPGTDFTGDDGKVEITGVVLPAKDIVEASDGAVTVQNLQAADLMGLDDVRSDPRFAGIDGAGYTVVVIDTGIDLNHSAFGPDINGDGISDRIVFSADFTNEGDGSPDDVQGHGTNVASIIGSSNAGYLGVAPQVNIIALQGLGNNGSGSNADLEQALQWVVNNAAAYNIVAVNLSLGVTSNLRARPERY